MSSGPGGHGANTAHPQHLLDQIGLAGQIGSEAGNLDLERAVRDAGVDGVLILDYPVEEAGPLRARVVKAGLDPKNIKYLVFGHYHGDHTGGGRYLQRISGAKAVQHWSDWDAYLRPYQAPGGRTLR